MSGLLIESIEKPDLVLITGRRGGTLAGGKSTLANTLAYDAGSDSFNPNVMHGDRDDFPSAKTHPSPFAQTPEQVKIEKLKTDDLYIGLIDAKLRIVTRPHQKGIILGDWLPRFENSVVTDKLMSLKERYNVFVIFVECDPKVQHERLKQRAVNDTKAAQRDSMYRDNEQKFMDDFAARSEIDNKIFENFINLNLNLLHKVIDTTQDFPLRTFNSVGRDITIYDLNDEGVQNFIRSIVDFINFGHALAAASNSDASSGTLDFNTGTRFAMKSEVEAMRNSRKLSGDSKFSDSTGGVFGYNFTHSPLVTKPILARSKSVSSFFFDNRELPQLSLQAPVGVPTVRGKRPKSSSIGSVEEMKPFSPMFSDVPKHVKQSSPDMLAASAATSRRPSPFESTDDSSNKRVKQSSPAASAAASRRPSPFESIDDSSKKRVKQSSPAASADAESFNHFQDETDKKSVNAETPPFSSLSYLNTVKKSPVNNQPLSIFPQDISPHERSRPSSVTTEVLVDQTNEDKATTSSPRHNPW